MTTQLSRITAAQPAAAASLDHSLFDALAACRPSCGWTAGHGRADQ
jgi:hypothetical protein